MRRAIFVPVAILATLGLVAGAAAQQSPPSTDIHLFAIQSSDAGWVIGEHSRMTDREGYDNQPHFSPDGGSVFYTAAREGQTDIHRYDLQTLRSEVFLETPESEYSPTPMPDGSGLSVVRVEADGKQRLWRLPFSGEAPELLVADVEPVGYHAWVDAKRVVLFVLGDPSALSLAEIGKPGARELAKSVGRSIHRVPGRVAVSFVDKSRERWSIEEMDLDSKKKNRLALCIEGSEDYAWAPDGRLLMASKAELYGLRPGESEWTLVRSFEGLGLASITRLALSPDGKRLALVAKSRGPDSQ